MTSDIFKKTWPYVAIILAHVIWGINFVVAKFTLMEIPPMSLAFARFALALFLLSPFLIVERKIKIDKKDLPKLLTIGSLMATLNIAFFYLGLARTTVTSASVLTMTIPVLSVVGCWLFLKEKVYVANLVGITVGFLGTVLIFGIPLVFLGAKLSAQELMGNFLILLACVSWVAGAILSKQMAKQYSTLIITTVIFSVGMITFLIPALLEYFQNPAWLSQITYLGILGLFFIAIASSVCAYFLFEWGLSKLGVVKADLFQYLEPLIATTLGVIILNENVRFSFIIGALLIGLGVYLATLAKVHHQHHKAHRN